MRISNRIFPYPILNSKLELSSYKKTSSYNLKFNKAVGDAPIIDSSNIVFKNIHFNLNNNELTKLYNEGKIKCVFVIECSATVYRKMFDITDVPIDIAIPIKYLKDKVVVSSYLYATQSIQRYSSSDFEDDYNGYTFNVEKYNVLAIDEHYEFKMSIDPSDIDKIDSIFLVIRKDSNDQTMTYQSTENKINIFLSPDYYSYYDSMKSTSKLHNILFSIIVIPALSASLSEIKSSINDSTEIEDIIYDKIWFKSVCKSYEKTTGSPLTIDDINSYNSLELAQIVFNNSTCKGLKDFNDYIFNGNKGDEDDE